MMQLRRLFFGYKTKKIQSRPLTFLLGNLNRWERVPLFDESRVPFVRGYSTSLEYTSVFSLTSHALSSGLRLRGPPLASLEPLALLTPPLAG